MDEDKLNIIMEKYKNGISYAQIGRDLKLDSSYIRKLIKNLNIYISKQKIFTEEEKIKIIKMHEYGNSGKQIKEELNITQNQLQKIYKILGLKLRKSQHHYNHNYFNKINTPEKACLLGLICSDGSVSERSLTIGLNYLDYDYLNYFCSCLSDDLKLFNSTFDKNTRILAVTSKELILALNNLGIHQRKTKTLILPFDKIEKKFWPYLLRGFYEGDGSLSYYKDKRRNSDTIYGNWSIGITNLNALKQIQEILKTELNIDRPIEIKYNNGKAKGILYRYTLYNINHIKTVCDWMYQGALYCAMSRKYNKYVELMKAKGLDYMK